jgi:hypothetical protein
MEEVPVTHQKMIKSCRAGNGCVHLKVCLQPSHPPTAEDTTSWLLAHENVVEVWCAAGRIRYNSGNEKRYKTKYPLTIEPEEDAECPDFEEAEC